MNETVTAASDDDGFTLVELVIAIMILFTALAVASSLIVSMVTATIANRHADIAMSIASQTMETAVASDCGSHTTAPLWNPQSSATDIAAGQFFGTVQSLCQVPTGPSNTATDATYCPAAATAGVTELFDGTFRRGHLPTFDQTQSDLGSRQFTVHRPVTAVTNSGILHVCVTVRMVWRTIGATGTSSPVDDGSNDTVRLQRQVHVQWTEPRQTAVRHRDLVQVVALEPDAKTVGQAGRITVATAAGDAGWASIALPGTTAKLTLTAATNGYVIFPFLPDGTYTVTSSSGVRTVTVTASDRSQCVTHAGAIQPFTVASCV
jgi:type II secretory pathway pseudopilin PulG